MNRQLDHWCGSSTTSWMSPGSSRPSSSSRKTPRARVLVETAVTPASRSSRVNQRIWWRTPAGTSGRASADPPVSRRSSPPAPQRPTFTPVAAGLIALTSRATGGGRLVIRVSISITRHRTSLRHVLALERPEHSVVLLHRSALGRRLSRFTRTLGPRARAKVRDDFDPAVPALP